MADRLKEKLATAKAKVGEKGACAEWEPPIPLPGLPDAPAFPTHTLPRALVEYLTAVAETTNTPIDYPACFALAIAAGTIGASRALNVKAGHVQRSSIYLCAVAQKGSGKSPALDAVAEPVYNLQSAISRKKDKTDREKREKAFVADITVEKLGQVMHHNPRGVLMIRDELAAWLLSFNQYKAGGRGNDRPFYLSAWNGSPINVDRVKDEDADPLYIRYPCLSVVGTIQPKVFDRFRGDSDDGFYDRVLFCYPDEVPLVCEQWAEIEAYHAKHWADTLAALRACAMVRDLGADFDRPYFFNFDAGARAAWVKWTKFVADAVNATDFDPELRGPLVKLSGYAARLALVVHMLRRTHGETNLDGIDEESMARGAALGEYFFGHARRVWAAVGFDGHHSAVRKLERWVVQRNGSPFTRREAHRALQRLFPTSEALTEPLKILVQNCYLRVAAAGSKAAQEAAPNQPRAVVYEINPAVVSAVSAVTTSALSARQRDSEVAEPDEPLPDFR